MTPRWHRRTWHQPWAHCITTAVILALAALPVLASAQTTISDVEVYRSDEFGYLFWWDSATWSIEEDREAGSDWVRLSNETTVVDISGFVSPDVSAESCLIDRLDAITSQPDLVRFESLWSPGNPPSIRANDDDSSAALEMILAFETAEGRVTIAAQETCDVLVPGESLLHTSEWILAEAYNAQGGYFGATPLWTITRSRSTTPDAPGAYESFGSTSTANIPGSHGAVVGVVTLHVTICDMAPRPPVVVVENTGATDLAIAPDAFVAVIGDSEESLVSRQWLWPAHASDQAVVVQPNEFAILQLEISERARSGEIVYRNPIGAQVYVGPASGCRGAGGAGPVLIDMETD
jgi:hypothetical protein